MTGPSGVPDRTSGTVALVYGAIVIAVAVVVLAFLATEAPAIAVSVLVLDLLLYAAMVIARFTVRRTVPRQWTINGCLVAAAVLSLGAVILIGSQSR